MCHRISLLWVLLPRCAVCVTLQNATLGVRSSGSKKEKITSGPNEHVLTGTGPTAVHTVSRGWVKLLKLPSDETRTGLGQSKRTLGWWRLLTAFLYVSAHILFILADTKLNIFCQDMDRGRPAYYAQDAQHVLL